MSSTLTSALPVTEPVCLMDRFTAGILVELIWHPEAGLTIIVQVGDELPMVADVPDDKALDAFWHPFVYLPR